MFNSLVIRRVIVRIKEAGVSLLDRINSLGLLADRYLFSDIHLVKRMYSSVSSRSSLLLKLNAVVEAYRGILILAFAGYMLASLYLLKFYADGALLTTAAFQEVAEICRDNQSSTQEFRTSAYTTTVCFPADYWANISRTEFTEIKAIQRRTNPEESQPLVVRDNGRTMLLFINISRILKDLEEWRDQVKNNE